ncbi:MAG: P1 family peptidase [Anaerolineales bacterium]|nr:P1 family peptidase [Anaerolineales bacterium]
MIETRRARDLGLAPGILPPGPLNAITDVAGVKVGHFTLIEGTDIRTGVTAILSHGDNLYQDKVPAGLAVGNGFGKLMGATQLAELGEIETPILLTNTLAVPRAAEALIDWTLSQPGNEDVISVNPIVGETNDGKLNDIRARALTVEHMRRALENARGGPVAEGCVGAGTGTTCFGWKGGIGTSSRVLPEAQEGYTLGVLVQSNFWGRLQMDGIRIEAGATHPSSADGSIMIVLATDAPLSDRNLTRLARRGLAGLARTGADMSNGSGDYVIAFSTHEGVRRTPERRKDVWAYPEIPNDLMSPLFQAASECTEEAIYNSLSMATTMTGYRGVTVQALPLDKVGDIVRRFRK